MKKHLAWFAPIALVVLAGPQVFGGDDGPALFVIPQVGHKSVPAQPDVKKTVPAQPSVKKAAPAQKTEPTPAATLKPVPDPKAPYSGKRIVNRPITMPTQTLSRPDNRLVSGAGPGSIGRRQARLSLRQDGTFVVTGNIEGSGTWYQNGSTIMMDSPNAHYEGVLDSSTISGTRTFKAGNGSEPWSFVLNERALEIKFEAKTK
jgi:hypothetical protein